MNKSSILKDLNRIAQVIYDKKGFNILVLDVRNICTMTDFFIIAEGSVDRHVKALSHAIIDEFFQQGQEPLHVEGQQEGDWIVLDYGDVVIHLFIPELREKYALEELWNKGQIVDVKINTERHEFKNNSRLHRGVENRHE
jgi:ribosome-associated protein